MDIEKPSRSQKVITFGLLLYAVTFVAMMILRPGSHFFYNSFEDICQILSPLFGATGCFYYAHRCKKAANLKLGWLLIGLACLSWAIGQTCWTYYEVIRRVEVPSPGIPDIGYLGVYPGVLGGTLLLFGGIKTAGRARLILDSAIAASSIWMLSWFCIVQRMWHLSNIPFWTKIIDIAYPLGDVAALFCALVLLNSGEVDRTYRRSIAALSFALVLVSVSDTLYVYYNFIGAYHTGMWMDCGWAFGWLVFGCAALLPFWYKPKDHSLENMPVDVAKPRHRTHWKVLAPYIAAITTFVIISISDYQDKHLVTNSTLIAGFGLLLVVILRQILTLLDNQTLALQMSVFAVNLENLINQRTEQLEALFQLTKSVNDSLEVDQILSTAVQHIKHAFCADAVVIRFREEGLGRRSDLKVFLDSGTADPDALRSYIEQTPICTFVEVIEDLDLLSAVEQSQCLCLKTPLTMPQGVRGEIDIIRRNSDVASTDGEMLESIGMVLGAALQNAQMYRVALEQAEHDAITGLFHHRAAQELLDTALDQARREDSSVSVLLMDINNFKLFNETYGHQIGDQVLKQVAQGLYAECSEGEILGRYGGDEFLIILPNKDTEQTIVLAQRLRQRLENEGFQSLGDERTVPVTLSFGAASFPADCYNRHDLLKLADTHLTAAKRTEGDIVVTTDVQRSNLALRSDGTLRALEAMVTAVDNKDRYTRRHSEDVTEYALWIAEVLMLSEEVMQQIRVGGLLHDVGKIGVPDEILRKPGRLTEEEYDILKSHPTLGAMIVGAVPGLESVLDAVRSHHERWDGKGYPDGTAGDHTPLLGRILAVADAVSAMTTDRPYRKGMHWQVVLEEVQSHAGTQFDPTMAEAFLIAAEKRHCLLSGISAADEDSLPRAA